MFVFLPKPYSVLPNRTIKYKRNKIVLFEQTLPLLKIFRKMLQDLIWVLMISRIFVEKHWKWRRKVFLYLDSTCKENILGTHKKFIPETMLFQGQIRSWSLEEVLFKKWMISKMIYSYEKKLYWEIQKNWPRQNQK